MARLRLSLLGALQITLDGQPVSGFAYNKARALLAYLTVEADRPHHRDTLVGLLWPELPDPAARTNLRQALANLREAIGDASATRPFLRITRDSIQFNPASDYELDLAAFVALLAACENHTHRRLERCRSCAARMEQALALYRGDFLAGFSVSDSAPFEEWQLRQRERLHQQALDTLARVADYHERRGDDGPARHYTQRQIELEPWREEAHRQLMRLLARSHQRSAALAQYETCRRMLARDLGVEPEAETTALYECIRDGSGAEVPASKRTTQRTPSIQNFPAQTTVLIGREAELMELGALLENPACRLITIVGPGGIGKTRLALAAAAQQAEAFTHGATLVPLQAISEVPFVATAVLAALGVTLQGQRKPREQLLDYLREKELLLVLDNFEQLLAPDLSENEGAAELLMDVLLRAPRLTLLVTSRERLALAGEWLFDLSGLNYPPDESPDGIERYSAVQLFVQRARQVRRQFALANSEAGAVARICRLVQGLPLAIELAAAAVPTRSCQVIANAIERSLSVLAIELRAVPERQRSMWATFEHSWHLLSPEERQIFARLAVFRGGCTIEAAETIAGWNVPAFQRSDVPTILAALVDKSLLRWDGIARYELHELVRQYAGEKLEELGEAAEIRKHHAMYFLGLAETAEPKLLSGKRDRWLDQLEREHDNLRVALAWSQATADAGEIGLRFVGALLWFWQYRNYMSEGRSWAEAALATASSAEPRAWANALYSAGMLAWIQGDYTIAHARLMTSIQHWRETSDRRGLAFALSIAGLNLCDQKRYEGYGLCAESVVILREIGAPWSLAHGLYFFGNAAFKRGDYIQARSIYEESLALWRTVDDSWGLALPVYRLGIIAGAHGEYTKARALLEESLAIRRQVDHKYLIALSLTALADVALCQQEYRQAITWLNESLALYQELGLNASVVATLKQFAWAALGQGQLERPVRLWGAAQAIDDMHGIRRTLGESLDNEPDLAAARAQLGEAPFAAAWGEGHAMLLEQAIAYALEGSAVDVEQPARAVGASIGSS